MTHISLTDFKITEMAIMYLANIHFGSPSVRQRNAIQMAFRWQTDGGPLLHGYWVGTTYSIHVINYAMFNNTSASKNLHVHVSEDDYRPLYIQK